MLPLAPKRAIHRPSEDASNSPDGRAVLWCELLIFGGAPAMRRVPRRSDFDSSGGRLGRLPAKAFCRGQPESFPYCRFYSTLHSTVTTETDRNRVCRIIVIALVDRNTLALSCSRDSPAFVSSPPEFRRSAAMSVQYKAVSVNPPLYIVLYCLTPPQFHRYSSLTLCSLYPASGENGDRANCACNKSGGGGIRLVNSYAMYENSHFWQNRPEMRHPIHWQLTTGQWS
jgi:hypothetical protein